MTSKNQQNQTIAVDMMGGDLGISVVVCAVLEILRQYKQVRLVLVGDTPQVESILQRHLKRWRSSKALSPADIDARVSYIHAPEVVEMDESPAYALRHKRESSMRQAILQIAEGKADACVSGGNTGALVAYCRSELPMQPGIQMPAILAALPNEQGEKTYVLDLGADIRGCSKRLVTNAIMGSVVAEAVFDKTSPSVGLLNVGEEAIKGTEYIKKASERLAECQAVNYIGFVEGNDIFNGRCDVVVCDGFVGNSVLKACEGVAALLAHYLQRAFKRNLFSRLLAMMAMPILKRVHQTIDPDKYNGATLVGCQAVVVKSHGRANKKAIKNAIEKAIFEASEQLPQRIYDKLSAIL